jgi:hypothetical protein
MAIAAALQGFAVQARYNLTAGHKEMCFLRLPDIKHESINLGRNARD